MDPSRGDDMTAAKRTDEVSAEELRALVFEVASLGTRSERSDDLANYDPSQPRVPGGSPTGGEFLGYGAGGAKGKWSQPRSEGRRDSSPSESKSPASWKPSMSRDEAERWAKDSAVKEDLYHGTTKKENSDAIAAHGFDVTKAGTTTGNRGFLGEGVYVSSTKGIADILGDHFPGGKTLTLKSNVRKVMSHDEFTKLSSEVGFVQAVSRQYEKDNPKVVGPTRMAEIVQSRGYDGVMFTGGHAEMVVFDPKRIVVVRDSTSNALGELREAVWFMANYRPDQPRDPKGRFARVGGSGAGAVSHPSPTTVKTGAGLGTLMSGGLPAGVGDNRTIPLFSSEDHVPKDLVKKSKRLERSDDFLDAIDEYTGETREVPLHVTMNDKLRSGQTLDSTEQSVASQLDWAMSDFKSPITVYRGVGNRGAELLEKARAALESGGTIQDNGFGSTSLSPQVAGNAYTSGSGVVSQITLRHGAYIEPVSQFGGEQEVLTPRGIRYRVVGIDNNVKIGIETHAVVRMEEVL
jgi:hypothetical protein